MSELNPEQLSFPETSMEIVKPYIPEGGYKGIYMTTKPHDKDDNAIYLYKKDPEKSDYPTDFFETHDPVAIMIIVHEDVTREMLWKDKNKRGFDARVVKITNKEDSPVLGRSVFVYKKDIGRKYQQGKIGKIEQPSEDSKIIPSWATEDDIPF